MKTPITISALMLAVVLAIPAFAAQPMKSITIQNLNFKQALSPPVVLVHKPGFKIFEVGKPASAEVTALAEDGTTDGFKALPSQFPQIYKVYVFDGGISPGQSKALVVAVPLGYRVTILSMLATTNDGFTGLDDQAVPGRGYMATYYAGAYDAGSEANTESCAHVPGPPCGAHNVRVTTDSEGFVHMHTGIHGTGDLSPREFDWKGSVAKITISHSD